MKIPWKFKSKIFAVIDFLNVPSVLYFLQKNVTKRSRITSLDVDDNWRLHRDSLAKYDCKNLVFEFGAGKSLAQNLYLSDIVAAQLVVDLNHMADIELIETARGFLSVQTTLKSNKVISSIADLAHYGISYKSPYDASRTDLGDETLDACVSTNTLEHIPAESIVEIFKELRRVLKGNGIVSAKIDYSDHYAHTDSTISLVNYLHYSDNEWTRHNHRSHYQNRLRHYDYKKLFDDCGFKVIEEEVFYDEKNIPQVLSEKFKDKEQTWAATSAYFILMKK